MYIDVHTHCLPQSSDICKIHSLSFGKDNYQILLNSYHLFSLGIHPWYINKDTDWSEFYKTIIDIRNYPNMIALGEAGLDKLKGKPITQQMDLFKKQLELSQIVKRPLFVHCVKAYSEIQSLLKSSQISYPLIFHDYRGSSQQTEYFLKFPTYFSFGTILNKSGPKLESLSHIIPLHRIFLETDDQVQFSIQDRYQKLAELYVTSIEKIQAQIKVNFTQVFKQDPLSHRERPVPKD